MMAKLIKCLSLFLLLMTASSAVAQNQEQEDTDLRENFEIPDGTPIDISEKGITITPPIGWQVFKNYPNTTLLLQVPKQSHQTYQRTIQIMSFADPIYVDELTAEKFAPMIVQKFTDASDVIKDYKIRNYLPVSLTSGVDGQLFYAEFSVGTFSLMQMHVLISSATRHYLMTFTDLADYFSEKAPQDHLNEAWQVLRSVKLDSTGPSRLALPISIFIATAIVAILSFIATIGIRRRATRRYGENMKELESDSDTPDMPMSNSPEDIDEDKTLAPTIQEDYIEPQGDTDYDLGDFDISEDQSKAV